MRASLLLSLWVLGSATCQRVDEPSPPTQVSEPLTTAAAPPAPPPAPPPALPAQKAAPPTVDAGPCVAPLAEPPPPPAKPAVTCPADPLATPPKLAKGTISFPEATGAPTVTVEVARSSAEVQRGLMYRRKMPAEQGMIFVFNDVRRRTFWMKNTCLPLDMLFLAKDGTIAGILEQVPTLNEGARSVPCPAAYVLEMNAGWARRHGVTPGMKTDIKL